VPEGQKAFSNGALVDESAAAGGKRLFRFAPTPPLPSELVAFVAGPFDVYDGGKSPSGTPIHVLTPNGHAVQGRAGADATLQVLPRLEAYIGSKYPFGKLDHVALPEGAYGAVENPGLITYLAKRLLVPPSDPGPNLQLRRLEAHEIGHQWFGNLVTQSSWLDVWLSEGFATWISDKMIDEERPPERRKLEAISARERIMEADQFPNRAVRVPIQSRSQSKDVYNPVVYQKGAGILLMLDGWLGETKMRDGLRRYLKEHAWSTASTEDLASALQAESGLDVAEVLKPYLDKAGVPRIRGRIDCSPVPKLKLEQLGPGAVPVCYKAGAAAGCAVLKDSSMEIDLPVRSCPAFLYLNAGGTGYYRTEWTPAQLGALEDAGWTNLTPAEKLTLGFDLRAQRASSPEAKAILTRLASDREPAIATAAVEALRRAGE
jgi:alanyl aminopeptidase